LSKQPKLRLALITLAALLPTVACGPSTYNRQNKEGRSNLVQLIDAGCVFTFDENKNTPLTATFSDSGATDELLICLSELGSLKEINLDASPRVSDAGVRALARLPRLRVLNVAGADISDDAMAAIGEMANLQRLYIWRTRISDVGLTHLQSLTGLCVLNLCDTNTSDEGIRGLAAMTKLEILCVGNSAPSGDRRLDASPQSSVTRAGVADLRERLPATQIVFWSDDSHPSSPLIHVAGNNSPRIEEAKSNQPHVTRDARAQPSRTSFDWPGFLGPRRDGRSPTRGLAFDWHRNPPQLLWRRAVPEGYTSVDVVGNRLYHFGRVQGRERLSCFDAATGRTDWYVEEEAPYADVFGYGDGPRATPLVDGERVYMYSVNGLLLCRSTIDGHMLWRVDTVNEHGAQPGMYGFGSSPVIHGERLIQLAGNDAWDSGILVLNKFDGSLLYSVPSSPASYASPRLAAIDNQTWCLAFMRDGLLAFDVDRGVKTFEFPWQARVSGCVNAATPTIDGSQVLISESYGPGAALLELTGAGLRAIWSDSPRLRRRTLQCHWCTPILHEGYVYGCSGRRASDAELRCIEWSTGRVMWSQPCQSRCSLLYVDEHIIVQSEHSEVSLIKATPEHYRPVGLLNAPDGSRRVVRRPAWAAPALAGHRLYICGNRELVCYEFSHQLDY
jgi:outer membrane protein assembly factor BamB